MPITKMKRCLCGSLVERHQTTSGGWIVHCPDCGIAFGVKLGTAEVFDPKCISGAFETAEQAGFAWNEYIIMCGYKGIFSDEEVRQ